MVAKAKLNIIEVLISTVLIDLFISHYEFVSVNNMLEQLNFRKRTMKIPNITNSENIEAYNNKIINLTKKVYCYYNPGQNI